MPLTKTERMQRYRAKLKEDPERCQAALEYDKKRKQKERTQKKAASMTNKKILEEMRQKKREEMRRYRKKKREQQQVTNRDSLPTTSKQLAAKKREVKKKDRARKQNENTAKRQQRQCEEQRRKLAVQRTQLWRIRVKLLENKTSPVHASGPDSENEQPISPFGSPSSEKRATRKAKESLPRTPMKRARVVEKLMNSPRTSKILSEKGSLPNPDAKRDLKLGRALLNSMRDTVSQTKSTGTATKAKMLAHKALAQLAAQISKRYRVQRKLMTYVGMRRTAARQGEWWKPRTRKLRDDRIPDEVKLKIREFFLSAEVSRENPGKRYVMELDGCKVQRHTMTLTLQEAFATFKQMNPDVKVGFSTFRKCKAVEVQKVSETSRRTCLCMTCCNCALKSEALQKITKDPKYSEIKTRKEDLAKLSLCASESDACLKRTCDDCSVSAFDDHFWQLKQDLTDENVSWAKWTYINLQKPDGVVKRVVSCVPQKTSFDVFLKELKDDMETYPAHIHRAKWQHRQMQLCIQTLKDDEAMIVMDFAENYSCRYKDEIATAFFEQVQVTIHPMMVYDYRYHNDTRILMKHAVIMISDDLKHDSFAVKVFEERCFEILNTLGSFSKIHEWSDGCGVQYKAKTAFTILSKRGLNVTRHYFETSHGKNVCDGLGAIVKNSAHQAVVSGRKIISGARDVYDHAVASLNHDAKVTKTGEESIRQFMFIPATDIKRDLDVTQITTMKGTRKIHAIQCTGTPYLVKTRDLSCFCDGCISSSPCENSNYVQPWEDRLLQSKTSTGSKCIFDPLNFIKCKFERCNFMHSVLIMIRIHSFFFRSPIIALILP